MHHIISNTSKSNYSSLLPFFFSHSLGLNTALTLAILISLVMNAREKKKAEETDCWRESLARYTGVVGQGEINK